MSVGHRAANVGFRAGPGSQQMADFVEKVPEPFIGLEIE